MSDMTSRIHKKIWGNVNESDSLQDDYSCDRQLDNCDDHKLKLVDHFYSYIELLCAYGSLFADLFCSKAYHR